MNQTTLKLWAGDGEVAVTFTVTFCAWLTPEQYAKLYECVLDADTWAGLRECVVMLAKEWGIKVITDEATRPSREP